MARVFSWEVASITWVHLEHPAIRGRSIHGDSLVYSTLRRLTWLSAHGQFQFYQQRSSSRRQGRQGRRHGMASMTLTSNSVRGRPTCRGLCIRSLAQRPGPRYDGVSVVREVWDGRASLFELEVRVLARHRKGSDFVYTTRSRISGI